jgi:hypothetical protein
MINTDLQTAIPLPMDQIVSFCEKWAITRFELFGSILRKDFDPLKSDIDVMITIDPIEKRVRRYSLLDLTGMWLELKDILGREVDMIQRPLLETNPNPSFRENVLKEAQVVYNTSDYSERRS